MGLRDASHGLPEGSGSNMHTRKLGGENCGGCVQLGMLKLRACFLAACAAVTGALCQAATCAASSTAYRTMSLAEGKPSPPWPPPPALCVLRSSRMLASIVSLQGAVQRQATKGLRMLSCRSDEPDPHNSPPLVPARRRHCLARRQGSPDLRQRQDAEWLLDGHADLLNACTE